MANVALEYRDPAKRASDGEDAVRLLEAFGALAIAQDLRDATSDESADLAAQLSQIGASGLAAQSRLSGYDADRERLAAAVQALVGIHPPSLP